MNKQPTPKPCNHCPAEVLIARKARPGAGRSQYVVLDAAPLNPDAQHDGAKVRVLDGWHAYSIGHAREHVAMQASVLARPGDATDIHDLPWHRIHDCPNYDKGRR